MQSKPKTVMDEIVPINKLKPMRGPQGLAFGGSSNQLLAEGPPTTDQGPKYAESSLEDKYRNLSPEERNQMFKFFDDYHQYMFPDREEDLENDFLFQRLKEMDNELKGNQLMARYNRNMNGGIMANTEPKEKSPLELLKDIEFDIG